MKKLLLLVILLISIQVLYAETLIKPESVLYDAANSRWLVSDVGEHNTLDGRIMIINDEGEATAVFTDGLKDPKGICIFNNKLYAADLTNVQIIDLATGTLEKTVPIANAIFLNDICPAGDMIYLSDNQSNKIFEFNPADESNTVFCSASAPNGLIYVEEDNAILAASFGNAGKILKIDLLAKNATTHAETAFSYQDGITRDDNGYYYISNWQKGAVNKYNSQFEYIETLESDLNGPADIYYCTEKNCIAIPVMEGGYVTFYQLFDPPSKPVNLTPGNESVNMPTQFLFYWNTCERAIAYSVYISKDIFFDADKTIIGNTDSAQDTTYMNLTEFDKGAIYYWYVEAIGLGGSSYSDTILFITKDITGVEDTPEIAVSIFPIPAKEFMNVNFAANLVGNATITIFDMNGKLIAEQTTQMKNNQINTAALAKGLYTIVLNYNGTLSRATFIK